MYNINIRMSAADKNKMLVKEPETVNTYETINHVLVHLFNEIWELEEKAIITEEYKDISNNDMHIIEAIGLGKEVRCL